MEYGEDASFESFRGKLTSVMAVVEDWDSLNI